MLFVTSQEVIRQFNRGMCDAVRKDGVVGCSDLITSLQELLSCTADDTDVRANKSDIGCKAFSICAAVLQQNLFQQLSSQLKDRVSLKIHIKFEYFED